MSQILDSQVWFHDTLKRQAFIKYLCALIHYHIQYTVVWLSTSYWYYDRQKLMLPLQHILIFIGLTGKREYFVRLENVWKTYPHSQAPWGPWTQVHQRRECENSTEKKGGTWKRKKIRYRLHILPQTSPIPKWYMWINKVCKAIGCPISHFKV